jgi:hypothetical protein
MLIDSSDEVEAASKYHPEDVIKYCSQTGRCSCILPVPGASIGLAGSQLRGIKATFC